MAVLARLCSVVAVLLHSTGTAQLGRRDEPGLVRVAFDALGVLGTNLAVGDTVSTGVVRVVAVHSLRTGHAGRSRVEVRLAVVAGDAVVRIEPVARIARIVTRGTEKSGRAEVVRVASLADVVEVLVRLHEVALQTGVHAGRRAVLAVGIAIGTGLYQVLAEFSGGAGHARVVAGVEVG